MTSCGPHLVDGRQFRWFLSCYYCILTLPWRTIPVPHRSPIITPLIFAAVCRFEVLIYSACGLKFGSREGPFVPLPVSLNVHDNGSAHDYPQEPTEGEGDAGPLPVNQHLRLTCPAADISCSRSGLDNGGKTTILKRLNGEDIMAVSPTLGFNIKTFMHEG